jgi:hypothetical protein
MTTISVIDFSAHLQTYLNQATQGEKIEINCFDNHTLTLTIKDKPIEKKYTKLEMLKNISYYGLPSDSQNIDELLYS